MAKPKPAKKKPAKKAGKKKPVVAPEDRPLTELQEHWCQWMVSALVNFNGTEAARRAGYKGTDGQLAVIGSENRRKPNVAKRLEGLRKKALSGANITIEKVLRDLEVTRAQALEAGNYAAAARCSELQGKYLKMFVERIEHMNPIDEISDAQLFGLIQRLSAEANVDLSTAAGGDGPEGGAVSVPPGAATTH